MHPLMVEVKRYKGPGVLTLYIGEKDIPKEYVKHIWQIRYADNESPSISDISTLDFRQYLKGREGWDYPSLWLLFSLC